jgi:mono/diheme cytochrome c family protein
MIASDGRIEQEDRRVFSRFFHTPILVLVGVTLLSGCEQKDYPQDLRYEEGSSPHPDWNETTGKLTFHPESLTRGSQLPLETRFKVSDALHSLFGRPGRPIVNQDILRKVKMGDQEVNLIEAMDLEEPVLAEGSKLYRRYCLHCHGLTGDGNGPTGQFLNPRPRDFRKGVFKFRTTQGSVPSREDLKRTISQGIPGTSMPSFAVLRPAQAEALVSYLTHLSLRGKMELAVLDGTVDREKGERKPVEFVARLLQDEAVKWYEESHKQLEPPPKPDGWNKAFEAGVANQWETGRIKFAEKGCVECHGKDGRSDPIEVPTNLARRDSWGELDPPRDLTRGVYRGGSRPIDLYYRVRVGINGGGMPASPRPKPGDEKSGISDEELWNIVGYVLSLSHRSGRPSPGVLAP